MTSRKLAPIVLFVYNRPWHTQQTLEALMNNVLANESVLYIYADGAKADTNEETKDSIRKTREVIKLKQWCREVRIIESDQNKGLAKSIISGVTDIINEYGKIIVLEDDIVTSTGFLQYMNDALDLYESNKEVMHISGYVPVTTGAEKLPETYFLKFANCWGWATWKDSWQHLITDNNYLHKTISEHTDLKAFNVDNSFDFFSQIESNYKGRIDTWFVKWNASIFLKEGLSLYPRYSLVSNIGWDGSGVHCRTSDNRWDVVLAQSVNVLPIPIEENKYARTYFKRFYWYGKNSSLDRRVYISVKNLYPRTIKLLKSSFLHKIYSRIRYSQ